MVCLTSGLMVVSRFIEGDIFRQSPFSDQGNASWFASCLTGLAMYVKKQPKIGCFAIISWQPNNIERPPPDCPRKRSVRRCPPRFIWSAAWPELWAVYEPPDFPWGTPLRSRRSMLFGSRDGLRPREFSHRAGAMTLFCYPFAGRRIKAGRLSKQWARGDALF